jgi:NADPH2:quinone reductase
MPLLAAWGILCAPWASHLGATVIGTVSTEEKARKATELGCHHTINYSIEDIEERVRELTHDEGVHVVYESLGRATLAKSLRCIRRRRMCVAYGHACGVPDPVDIVKQLGEPRSLYITRPAIRHYLTPRSALLASAEGLFAANREGVIKSTISRLSRSARSLKHTASWKVERQSARSFWCLKAFEEALCEVDRSQGS